MKCQCCKENEVTWAWQPFGPDSSPVSYALLGNHYRGFPVIKVCSVCKVAFESGDEVRFDHRGGSYVGKDCTVFRMDDLAANEKVYTNLQEAEAAMGRGETVRIAFLPSDINPQVLQLAQDLQDKQRLEEWKRCQNR